MINGMCLLAHIFRHAQVTQDNMPDFIHPLDYDNFEASIRYISATSSPSWLSDWVKPLTLSV